jgi:hypothetical protein
MNHEILLETIIQNAATLIPDKSYTMDLIVCNDWNGLNNGVFFIRNSP